MPSDSHPPTACQRTKSIKPSFTAALSLPLFLSPSLSLSLYSHPLRVFRSILFFLPLFSSLLAHRVVRDISSIQWNRVNPPARWLEGRKEGTDFQEMKISFE